MSNETFRRLAGRTSAVLGAAALGIAGAGVQVGMAAGSAGSPGLSLTHPASAASHTLGLLLAPAHQAGAGAAASPGSSTAVSVPGATATGNAVSVPMLHTCVACTGASSGSGGAAASAQGLTLLGTPVVGGASSGSGSQSGSLLAVPANPLLGLALLDWATSTRTTPTGSSGTARSAVADVVLANGTLATLAVLEGNSTASSTSGASTGTASTNGVHLTLGNGALALVVLHTGSDGTAYLASINGTQLLTMSNGQGIPVTIPGVGTVVLLQSLGAGGTGGGANGVNVSGLLGQSGTQANVLGASGAGAASAPAGTPPGGNGAPPTTTGNGVPPAADGTPLTTAPLGGLTGGAPIPNTGVAIGLAGFGLLGAGTVLLTVARRRREA